MVPFAGYDMPVWYTSVSAEHGATRTGAGLFDVSHMGVFDFRGPGAEPFLNALTTNDVTALEPGHAHYNYLLGVDGVPIDDIFIYRLEPEYFVVVVNASNNDKDWAWITGLQAGKYAIDPDRPDAALPGRDAVSIRDLRDPALGAERGVDIALQGREAVTFCSVCTAAPKIKRGQGAALGRRDARQPRRLRPDRGADRLHRERSPMKSSSIPIKRRGCSRTWSKRRDPGRPGGARIACGPRPDCRCTGTSWRASLSLNPADAGFGSYAKLWKPFLIGKARLWPTSASATPS